MRISLALIVSVMTGSWCTGATLSTRVHVPGLTPAGIIYNATTAQGNDNNVYSVAFESSVAQGQADYGILRNYVAVTGGYGEAHTLFRDSIFINSPADGLFTIDFIAEGTVRGTVPVSNTLAPSFIVFDWTLTNSTAPSYDECYTGRDLGSPSLPYSCSMSVSVTVGLNRIDITGNQSIATSSIGFSEIDMFGTTRVTGASLTDLNGAMMIADVTTESGTVYAASAVPEPTSLLLSSLGLGIIVCFAGRRERRHCHAGIDGLALGVIVGRTRRNN